MLYKCKIQKQFSDENNEIWGRNLPPIDWKEIAFIAITQMTLSDAAITNNLKIDDNIIKFTKPYYYL